MVRSRVIYQAAKIRNWILSQPENSLVLWMHIEAWNGNKLAISILVNKSNWKVDLRPFVRNIVRAFPQTLQLKTHFGDRCFELIMSFSEIGENSSGYMDI